MNDTRILPETATVAAYVARVRAALADLPAEEVDDLTQGMEADLTEAMTEGAGDLTSRFGAPEAYAAELRSAAGLPPATVEGPARTSFWSGLTAAAERWQERHGALVQVGHELAPAWWLARGIGAGYLVSEVMSVGLLIAVVALVAASLYLGVRAREHRAEPLWPRTLDRLWNLAGLLLVPIAAWLALGFALTAYGVSGSSEPSYTMQNGLVLDGRSVDGIYAYGPDGKRLDDVRLFAQDGTPITVDSGDQTAPWVDQAGRQWFNVFPSTTSGSRGWTVPDPGSWHPPMTIDRLVRQVPTETDPSTSNPGAEGAPTETTPTGPATSTATGTSTQSPVPSGGPTPTAPVGTASRR